MTWTIQVITYKTLLQQKTQNKTMATEHSTFQSYLFWTPKVIQE